MKGKAERRGQVFDPEDILELLLDKLSRRGILFTQTPRFVKDVLNIIAEGHSFTETAVNEKLGRLGWGEHILDGYILELIRFLSENHRNLSPRISAPPLPVSPCAGRSTGEAARG